MFSAMEMKLASFIATTTAGGAWAISVQTVTRLVLFVPTIGSIPTPWCLKEGLMTQRDVWRYSTMEILEQSVTTSSAWKLPTWFVDLSTSLELLTTLGTTIFREYYDISITNALMKHTVYIQ